MRTKAGRRFALRRALGAALVAAAPSFPALAADTSGTPRLTILDGEASLVEGAQRLAGVEGQVLHERTLIETGKETRLLRIEWPDGQAVDLGPDTRAMLAPPPVGGRGSKSRAVYLLQGWAKQTSPDESESEGLVAPDVDIEPFRGAVVSYVHAEETWLFAETGRVSIAEREKGRSAKFNIPQGSAYTRIGNTQGAVTARPSSAAMKRVPRAFRDPLPLRYGRMKDAEVTATVLAKPTYAELQPWLTAETAVRAGFVSRFDELLRDRAFRREIDKHMRDHREWYRVLHPKPPAASEPAKR